MISEAKAFWDSISGKVKSLIRKETENAMRLQRYDVTTAPNGTVMGVRQPFGNNEIFLPYSQEVASATVGDTVLVTWWGSMSNAKVYYFADGYEAIPTLSLLDIYPVGSIYMSVNSTSPAALFGGTWERIQDTFLLAAGTNHAAGSTGGEENHVLTVNEMPSHNHNYAQYVGCVGWTGSSNWNVVKTTNNDGYTNTNTSGYMSTFNKGGGQAHNNMPPFLAVYVWKRTA